MLMSEKEVFSKTISFVRFPLIVGVVFIHIPYKKMTEICPGWGGDAMCFFSDILPRICVPLFFLISGYLFFDKGFDFSIYKTKLNSRFRSLLIPYLLWNFVGFLLYYLYTYYTTIGHSLRNSDIDLGTFFQCFWVFNKPNSISVSSSPVDFPLWFLRDLILLVICSPIIYRLLRACKVYIVLLLGIIWFFRIDNGVGIPLRSYQSLFFFPLGAYLAINKINCIKWLLGKENIVIAYLLIAVVDLITKDAWYNIFVHNSGICLGMISFVSIISSLIQKDKIKVSRPYSSYSYFIYLFHGLFIHQLSYVLLLIVKPESHVSLLIVYFSIPFITVLICIGIYKVLMVTTPKLLMILTGQKF